MELLINVINQKLKLATNLKNLVAGSQQFIKLTFNLSEEWDDLLTFAQFIQGENAYSQYLDENNSVYLPHEIQAGTCKVILYGTGSQGEGSQIIATTNYLEFTIDENITVANASSTEISQSLYDQLANQFNTIAHLDQSQYGSMIMQQVNQLTSQYLANEEWVGAAIQDGTITKAKLDSNVSATLDKADNSWQKGTNAASGTWDDTYDTNRRKTDIFNYVDGEINSTKNYVDGQIGGITNRTATGPLDLVTQEVNDAKIFRYDYTPQYQTNITGQKNYTTLKDAVQGIYAEALGNAKDYADAKVRESINILIVDELPTTGQARTFYLVPKESGNGYDKWWYVTNSNGVSFWDTFGSTSTVIVPSLASVEAPSVDVDYIVQTDSGYLYYKYIDNQWEMIAGSSAEIISPEYTIDYKEYGTPQSNDYSAEDYSGKYYLNLTDFKVYLSNGANWSLVETLAVASELTDYYLDDGSGTYVHYRYIDNEYKVVGADAYSKSEVDSMIQRINSSISSVQANINTNADNISTNTTGISRLNSTVSGLQQTVSNIDTTKRSYRANKTYNEETGVYTYHLIQYEGDDTENGTEVSSFVLPSGGGSGTGQQIATTLTVTKVTSSPLVVTTNDRVVLEYIYESLDSDNAEVDGTYTWKLDGRTIATGTCVHRSQGNNIFDVTDYCTIGKQKFTLTITDGVNTTLKSWSVEKVDVRIESDFNDRISYQSGNSVGFTYIPHGGTLSKTVHFILDGEELGTVTTNSSGTSESYTIPAQSHGSHLLECYLTVVVNSIQVETNHIYKDIVWYDINDDDAIIGCMYRNDYYGKVNVRQYDTLPIVYNVYDPTTITPVVKRYVDGVLVGTDTVSTVQNTWNFKSNDIGEHTLIITVRNTSVTIIANVTELGINVSPITTNLQIDFNPIGVNNSSSNRLWSNNNYSMTVSNNFDWVNGGYKTDENGDSYFLIKSGTRVQFDYQMFSGGRNNNPSVLGAEMKLIFMTENVQNANAVWFSNVETNGTEKVGIQLGVHEGWLKTDTASDTDIVVGEGNSAEQIAATNTYLYMPYSEEDIIEMDINISTINTEDESAKSFIMAYEDGVPSKAFYYTNADRLYQYDPQYITIGSDYCDVRIYRMKIYSSSLSTEDIMKNFIADSRNTTIMLNRYDRNSIYYNNTTHKYSPYRSDGVLDPEKLAFAMPNVKVLMLDTDHFTTSKKTFIKSSLKCIHAPNGSIYAGDSYSDNWYFENGWHSGQGTTSDNYGVAGRNVDFLFNCDGVHHPSDKIENVEPDYISQVTLGMDTENRHTEAVTDWKGNTGKVSLTNTSIPNNFFNFKVNIASSENVNNALLQKRYNDFLPYVSPAARRNNKIKNDMEFVPAVLFVKETNNDISTHTEFKDNDYHFYALGNLGDSKKTDYTRAYDPEDMNEFTIEISDNPRKNATFQTGIEYVNGQYRMETFKIVKTLNEKHKLVKTPVAYNPVNNHIRTIPSEIVATHWDAIGTITVENNTGDSRYDGDETGYLNMRRWCLENEAFDGDHSFEPRYACCGDFRDGKLVNDTTGHDEQQVLLNNDVWRAFYKWVVLSTDEEFVNELKEWCVESAVLFFYAFTHFYTMMDNRAKNTFWHFAKTGTYRQVTKPVPELLHIYSELVDDEYITTEDTTINPNKTYYTQYAFDMWMYDGDTALGINNNGELTFPYGKEDSDYNIDNDSTSGYIFNGATSVFWCKLRDLFQSRIISTFNSVRDECFSAENLIKQFDEYQECYPEEIWRLDIERKYIRPFTGQSVDNSIPKHDERYLRDMMQGRKKYQRRQWIRDQEFYFGTKNLMNTVVGDNNRITFRCYTPTGVVVSPNYNISITPYSDMYVSVMYGNGNLSQKRAKAGVAETVDCSDNQMTDLQIVIYGANRIQALNDLSACYVTSISIAGANKLKKIVLGNTTTGYNNPRLTSLSLGDNKLLEEVDIRNCSNFNGALNFSQSPNLTKLLAEGTKITSVIFATNGKLQIAHLPDTIGSLTMRGLNNISDFQATLNNVTKLTLQGGSLDSRAIVSSCIDTLNELYLYDIDWTGTHSLIDTTLLNSMYNLSDEYTLVTGDVYISGNIRTSERDNYQNKSSWSDLNISFNSNNVIPQYLVTYVNPLPNGTELYRMYYDFGSELLDPVANDLINTPIMASDDEYNYTFLNWKDSSDNVIDFTSQNTVTENMVITANYTKTKRTYTVAWYAQGDNNGNPVISSKLDEVEVEYGSEVSYEYQKVESPTSSNLANYYEFTGGQYISSASSTFSSTKTYYTKRDLPTDTSGEINGYYRLFKSWDKSTGYIRGNINVIAQWETRSGLPSKSTDLKDMSCVDIYAVCQAKKADKEFDETNGYWLPKDYFEITLGHDLDFSNVTSKTLVDLDHPVFFNGSDGTNTGTRIVYNNGVGTTYQDSFIDFDGSNSTTNPEIKLFSADAPSFTLAIEYEYLSTNTNGVMLSAGSEDDVDGFKLNYSSSNPCIRWGNNNQAIGASDIRNVMVLRHVKGSDILYAYTYNSHSDRYTDIGNSSYPLRYMLQRTNTSGTEPVLSLGAVRYKNGVTHDYFAKGWVYWCKLWEDDLGDTNAKFLAAWIHEKIRMEYTGRGTSGLRRYAVANTNSQVTTYAEASFLANNSLSLLHNMNNSDTNVGGWATSNMRSFLNARVYNALPVQWRSAIKSVNVKSSIGGGSSGNKVTTTSTSVDKLYLAAYTELIGANSDYNGETYNNNIINYFVSNSSTYYYKKVKFIGLIIKNQGEDGTQYFGVDENLSIDPTDSSLGYTVNEGDVWFRYDGANKIGYMYISEDTLAKHTRIGYRAVSSTDNIVASAGGRWVRASSWWERSPYVTNSTNFLNVYNYGYPHYATGASYATGVAVGFSV